MQCFPTFFDLFTAQILQFSIPGAHPNKIYVMKYNEFSSSNLLTISSLSMEAGSV